MELQRVSNITIEKFVCDYVKENRPVIVVDAIERWKSKHVWSPEYFSDNFGGSPVQVYDDLFSLQTVTSLDQYFDEHWYNNGKSNKEQIPYVRWYAKFKPVDFWWSDEAFMALSPFWSLPYFLPASEYLLPYCPREKTVTPAIHAFPGKGLFISAAGARTRLHKDPWASDAILCQVFGEKNVVMYHPDKESGLKAGNRVVDIDNPDGEVFARFHEIEPDFIDVLRCGEIIYIPAGWFHHVTSRSNSISLTWNFVLMSRWASFLQYLLTPVSEEDRTVIKYFASMDDSK
jgi:cupin-like protein